MAADLPPMAPGGEWMQRGDGFITYVVHPDHIKRVLTEGWRVVADPRRVPSTSPEGSESEPTSKPLPFKRAKGA